jgi:cardiolipin synthase
MTAWFPRMTAHSLAIVLSLLTYVLTTRAEHERRPPSIAISWVLGLIALPYLTLPVYLLFGRRKLQRKITPYLPVQSSATNWAEHLIESFGLPGAAPARVRLHQDGAQARRALYEVMSRASRRLDICTYILGNDPFGEETTAQMIACVKRGVRVRFLIDGVGAMQLSGRWFKRMHAAGAETGIFSPLLARKTPGPRNLRNHRKWAIADGEMLWAGGRNLAAEYFCGDEGSPPWADLTFDLEGPVAASAANQFEADWCAAGGRPAARSSPAEGDYAGGRDSVSTERSRPDRGHGARAAHRRVLSRDRADACHHPVFRPRLESGDGDSTGGAARREDRSVHPGEIKSCPGGLRAQPLAARTVESGGVDSFAAQFMNHAKAVVFDHSIALCGSVNLDSRSLLLNYESAVVFYGKPEIEWLATWIVELIPDATPLR